MKLQEARFVHGAPDRRKNHRVGKKAAKEAENLRLFSVTTLCSAFCNLVIYFFSSSQEGSYFVSSPVSSVHPHVSQLKQRLLS